VTATAQGRRKGRRDNHDDERALLELLSRGLSEGEILSLASVAAHPSPSSARFLEFSMSAGVV
jgi:hypothetical protein